MLLLEIVAKALLAIVPAVISALTINELVNNPAALLCTTPAAENASMVTPDELIFIRSTPLVSNDNVFAVADDIPVLVPPVNWNDGAAAVPAGTVSVPVSVPPVSGRSNDAPPVRLAV